ncbi:MAG: hypothetical protein HY289_09135 [Planctomycetes bacterium]|nr:hypothetical protein [Planctomycetota bacterium]
MPAVRMTSREQYVKAIGVLTRVGGTWQGVGDEVEPSLLVNPKQYQALVDAGVVAAESNGKEPSRGKKSRKGTRS